MTLFFVLLCRLQANLCVYHIIVAVIASSALLDKVSHEFYFCVHELKNTLDTYRFGPLKNYPAREEETWIFCL